MSTSLAAASLLCAKEAAAEVTLLKTEPGKDGWEFYTNGRVNAFVSWSIGDNMPVAPRGPNGELYGFKGAGGTGVGDTEGSADPIYGPDGVTVVGHTQGTVNSMRLRSGFVANTLGFGVRRNLTDTTKASAFVSIWSNVESAARRKYLPNLADVREGYLKIEGPWGTFLAGKALSLYNRGATEADFMYMHGYGLGYPGSIIDKGPASGMIGFGVLASTFSGGFTYTTPQLAGLQLAVGAYDPATLVGSRFERTGFLRPEGELTFDHAISDLGKVHVYLNGTIQKLYVKQAPDSDSATAKGFGAGARLELGPVHLAGGVHRGKGLGLTFALEPSESTYNGLSQLRDSSGFYGFAQVVLGKIDVNLGFGQTSVKPLANDLEAVPGTDYPSYSLIRTQTGVAAAVVYHPRDWLHFDVDFMRADFKWTLKDRQQINFINAGPTITW